MRLRISIGDALKEDIKASRDLQRNFQHPETAVEQRTAESIAQYLKTRKAEWGKRNLRAVTPLGSSGGIIGEARNQKSHRGYSELPQPRSRCFLDRLADLRRTEANNEDARIFPMMYAPVLVRHDGKTMIRPMRYTCRFSGKPAEYDKRFPDTYNARRDSLDD